MRVIMVQPRFWGAVRSGVKRSTIRLKARCKAGDELSIRGWCGAPYRSKQQLIRTAECKAVAPVVLREGVGRPLEIEVEGCLLTARETAELVRGEGFADAAEMRAFFEEEHGLPCEREIITW